MNRFKVLLTSVLIFSMGISNVYAIDHSEVILNGVSTSLSKELYADEANVYVSLRELAELLDSEVTWDDVEKAVSVNVNDTVALFKSGSVHVKIDGLAKTMSSAMIIKDGTSYVPLNSVVDIFGGELTIDGDLYSVDLYLVTDQGFGLYTFDELYVMAIENSDAVKEAEKNLEKAEILEEKARNDYRTSPGLPSGPSNGADGLVRLANLQNLTAKEISLKTAEIAIETSKDQTGNKLWVLIESVVKNENSLSLVTKGLAVERVSFSHEKIKFENGLISQVEFEKAENNLKVKENTVNMQTLAVNTSYIKLDDLLQLGLENYNFVRNFKLELSDIPQESVDLHVVYVLENSPTIWTIEQQVNLVAIGVDYYVYNAGSSPYAANEVDLNIAKLNLRDAKEQTELSLRENYNNLVQLRDSYDNLILDLEKAKQDYRVAKLNYETGLVTALTVELSELAIKNFENQILSTISSYNSLLRAYERPWSVSVN